MNDCPTTTYLGRDTSILFESGLNDGVVRMGIIFYYYQSFQQSPCHVYQSVTQYTCYHQIIIDCAISSHWYSLT